jgi:hypothetical protein
VQPGAGWWRDIAVRTGTTGVMIRLRIASDLEEEAQLPHRPEQLLALYRLLPAA